MQYRKFGKLDWDVSVLGFGAMRLPTEGGDDTNIDEPEAIGMMRYGIDRGINYIDTAYPYHGGKSEVVVGKALKDGYRDKVKVATKLPCFLIQSADQFDLFLNEQLKRLQTETIDFYLLHGLNRKTWKTVHGLDVLRWAEGAIADGRIRHLGFSFHDELDIFRQIVDAYGKWTFCQIQYNYMDTVYQAGTAGLRYAVEKGLAVVVMEPLRGGRLTKKPSQEIARLLGEYPIHRSPADWALRWVWNDPAVSVALSGMSTMEQVVENVSLAERAQAQAMSAHELTLIERVREAFKARAGIDCSGCRYCVPCPHGVDIPLIFELYNDVQIYVETEHARFNYRKMEPEKRADMCMDCGECLDVCPQDLDIPRLLKQAHELLHNDSSNT